MKRRGATPEADRAAGWITEGPITRVDPTTNGWSITADGWTTHLTHERAGLHTPTIGDTFTTFGQIGYSYHGQALNGEVLWYQSVEDEEAQRLVEASAAEQRRRDQFAAEQPSMDAAYDALPETFRDRIDKFRAANPNFRWEYEAYELSCCTDAVKIARYCSVNRIAVREDGAEPTAAENIEAYRDLPYNEQLKAGISDGHSGNSFAFAVRLAYSYATDPGMVVADHGAMAPLVGCNEYGCHAA